MMKSFFFYLKAVRFYKTLCKQVLYGVLVFNKIKQYDAYTKTPLVKQRRCVRNRTLPKHTKSYKPP